jgi:exonuclease SbcC
MIPLSLELKNFLSYGEQTQRIEFKDYSLICLSGKNGHGKSALLDALTWALWGQARKTTGTTKADEGLLRLGQTRMLVSLEFLFSDHTYRVRREFAKTYGKPYSALDFEMFDSTTNKFISLTDKTVRATQSKIEQLVGLDYETFINTAFLRQGQSNEFSKKTAKERKHILATILGLSKYDALQQQALEKIRQLNDEKRSITLLQEQLTQDLAKEEPIFTQIQQEKELLVTITSALEQKNISLKEYEKNLALHQAQKDSLNTIKAEYAHKENVYKEHETNFKNKTLEWRNVHALSLKLPNIHALKEEQKTLALQEKEYIQAQQKILTLHEKILQLKDVQHKQSVDIKKELDVTIAQQRLTVNQQELAYLQQKTVRTHQEQANKDLQTQINLLEKQKTDLEKKCTNADTIEKEYIAIKNQFEKRRAYYQTLVQRGNWTSTEIKDLAHKQTVVQDAHNPACPLCDQLLTAKRKQFLSQQFSTQETFLVHRLQRISDLHKKLKELLVEQHNQVQTLTRQSEQLTQQMLGLQDVNKRLVEALHNLEVSTQKLHALIAEENRLESILKISKNNLHELEATYETKLLQNNKLIELALQIQSLEKEKESQAFNADAYHDLQAKIKHIDTEIVHADVLHQSINTQQERRNHIKMLYHELKNIKKSLKGMTEQLQQYESVIQQEQLITQKMNFLNQEILEFTKQKDQKLSVLGSLEYEFQRLQKTKIEIENKKKLIKKFDRELEDYQALSTALSKNGIQALLIEEAIPEIEQEANIILARLTDNQAQIFIESLRDLKSGGVKETLDIQIADAAGIRPYEMYSGGEAFRVDFALRIAIAKLLARRAGTALQTLIIDEGFGSQDEDGLTHMMDSIYAIQNDFSKIIIVSHLPDFKHNFPVHFIIEKNVLGSTIRVEERG